MKLFLEDLKRLPKLFLGFIVLALGIYLTKISLLGMSSWGVFHDGLAIQVSWLSFGSGTMIVGAIILLLSIFFLGTKVGLGTILNVFIVGPLIDLFDKIYPVMPDDLVLQIIVLIFGILFTTLGRSFYIASRLGPGPRDGLFVGLARITNFQVKYIKITIEFIVLGIGILLGGQFGVGTVVMIIVAGYLVQFFFKVFKFDPKTEKQNNILDYFQLA
ncbi:hypothetical protein KQ51_01016 [Candidatus Izimaplasma bacterium HR1]|jgi:uncharacterized membrane protein YczE|uniref:YczE/YyaS/YitT family protein n=1 Tax=Candidatus Izimoplasma sp. HR1 TaxID=1541959 RepID=UPI0004F62964|nr:hypothetical protein KQ51_01016 [Candidatus Izimaplasma bacterium HR1]